MDTVALALAKKFTSDTASSFGAVKGANCQVSGYEYNSDGDSVITFAWKNASNESRSTQVIVKKGNNGIGLTSLAFNDEMHLIATYSDGSTSDCGAVVIGGLSEDLTATVDIGTVTNGKKYVKGTPLETIIRDILIKVVKPSVSIVITPATTVYDVVSETLPSITLKGTVTKGTNNLTKIEFKSGNTVINSQTISNAGTFVYAFTPESPIKTTTTFGVVATDINGLVSNVATKTVYFVGKSYHGVLDDATSINADTIKTLTSLLVTTKGGTFKEYYKDNGSSGRTIYAYPKSFGALSTIKNDKGVNYAFTGSNSPFVQTTMTIDNIEYYVYNLVDSAGIDETYIYS